MKIAVIATATIPSDTAHSIHIMQMAQALQQEGHATTLWLPTPPPTHRLNTAQEAFAQYGIHTPFDMVHLDPPHGPHNLWFALRALRGARRAGTTGVLTRVPWAAALSAHAGVSTLCELHDLPAHGRALRLYARGRDCRGLVTITAALRDAVLERFGTRFRPEEVLVCPDGVDLTRFADLPRPAAARAALGLEAERFTAGYVGGFYPGRGIEKVLDIARRCPGIGFLLVGATAAQLPTWEERCRRAGLQNVTLKPHQPPAAIPPLLAACDALLMPYQHRVAVSGGGNTARWMSPMKMFEYMACARTILASDLPALREVLNDGNSLLLPPADADAWAAALQRCAGVPATASARARQARADVEDYTWRQRARTLAGRLQAGQARD